jgi:hypothetical protein
MRVASRLIRLDRGPTELLRISAYTLMRYETVDVTRLIIYFGIRLDPLRVVDAALLGGNNR